MKKLFTALLMCAFTFGSAAAYEMKDAYYFGPYAGYKAFDDKSDFKNDMEVGLKLGYFITEHWAAELSGGYAEAEYDSKSGSEDVLTPGLHALYHFRPSMDNALLPFLQAGVETRIADDTNTGLAVGGGLKYLFTKSFAGDVSFKNIYFGEGKHDQLMAVSVAYFFGVREKAPVMAAEPVPTPVAAAVKEEPAPMAAVVAEEKKEAVVVAPVDSDGDGVYDDQDQCPGTPQGYDVNEKGCFKNLKLYVNFANDSDMIDDASMVRVREFADFMKATPVLKVEIQGHTDSKGTEAYNQKLSERRAEAISSALINLGIEADRVSAKGYGETKPIAPNASPEDRAKNRRIEAVAVDEEGMKVQSQKPE
ncbi:hypothetical protein EP073_07815 [Geovibrio thiophilus]|uniref:OmpA-like domain-containing protein n=1 Tax=Geovibrio thiophilus TaxID=139438 RepID=A0A3R5XXP2_9BACT|nr:OmpA family protein [Geovibrio thiophilus]QAR33309.1 hypothetical protein EP073_07815 [Geovibrio thiophilus]